MVQTTTPFFASTALLLLHLSPTTASAVLPKNPRASTGSNPGVDLVNAGSTGQTFVFCNNVANGDGEADPGFTSGSASSLSSTSSTLPSGCQDLVTTVSVAPSATASVTLDLDFKGRVARTTDTPATWVEIQISNTAGDCGDWCGWGWGDISLEMGCDGAATIAPADGSSTAPIGFTGPSDLVENAPSQATTTRGDGTKVITAPWFDGIALSQDAIDYLVEKVGNEAAYINVTSGTEVAASPNNRFLVTFY